MLKVVLPEPEIDWMGSKR